MDQFKYIPLLECLLNFEKDKDAFLLPVGNCRLFYAVNCSMHVL